MTVYIASMNMRGTWAPAPVGTVKLNVTSFQSKSSKLRRDFSPMNCVEYRGFYNFEAYWQSGKVYESISPSKTRQYWASITTPRRRYPGSKGKRVWYAEWTDGCRLGYIDSRKQVYVPQYYELMQATESAAHYRQLVLNNVSVVVYDFDGPRTLENAPTCLEVSKNLLVEKINDPRHPFGHGYIVAGYLLGILPTDYC